MIKKVCIFGSYKDLSKKEKEEIVRLGKLLAQEGATVMSGGFGGTMEDISRGAKSVGGKTIGVTWYKWEKPIYKNANAFIDEEIVADTLFERIDIMLKKADVFIVLPGGTGTLLELSAVLEHLNKGLIDPKPIIMLGDFWKPALACLKKEPVLSEKTRSKRNISCCDELVIFVKNVDECIEKLEEEK
ncbi:MAG: LOG family protein [Candidatus Omnitrophica bacterium]|nr:LOG family protein [Candidatus Omnitrophota bacterium]